MASAAPAVKRRRKDYKTSDPESSALIPLYFKNVLKNTQNGGYWVLFHYDDGSYYLMPPPDVRAENIMPQQRFIELFKDKEIMDVGMKVRVFWDTTHPVGKATVIAVDTDQAKMNLLFNTLEKAAREQAEKKKKRNVKPALGRRMKLSARSEDIRKKRSKLNGSTLNKASIVRLQKDADETEPSINSSDDDFAPGPKIRLARPFALQQDGSNESEMESRFAEDSDAEGAQRSTRSISGKSLPIQLSTQMEVSEPNVAQEEENMDAADFDDDTYHPWNDPDNRKRGGGFAEIDDDGNSVAGAHYSTGNESPTHEEIPSYTEQQLADFRAKRDEHRKEFQKYESMLKKAGEMAMIRKPKITVPSVQWSFLPKDPKAVDRRIYQRLDVPGAKKSDMWVKQTQLKEVQKKAKDMDSYAQKLMWKALISEEELIEIAKLKSKGVGLAKLFGTANFNTFYDHVVKYRNDKASTVAGKWNNEITTAGEMRRKFISSFDRKVHRIINNISSSA